MVIRSSVTPRKVNRSYMLISSSPRTRSVSQSRAPDDPTMMWARRYRSNGAPQPGASGRDVRGGLGRLRPATDDQEDDGDGDRRDRGRDQCGGEWETDERGADQVGKRTGVHRPEHTADRRPQQEGAIRVGGEPERGTGHDADAGHVATEGQQDGRARADHPEGGRDALTLHRRVETRLETSAIEPDDPVQRGVTHDGSSRAGQHDQRQLQVATGGEGRGSVERRLTRQQCADRVAENQEEDGRVRPVAAVLDERAETVLAAEHLEQDDAEQEAERSEGSEQHDPSHAPLGRPGGGAVLERSEVAGHAYIIPEPRLSAAQSETTRRDRDSRWPRSTSQSTSCRCMASAPTIISPGASNSTGQTNIARSCQPPRPPWQPTRPSNAATSSRSSSRLLT